MTISYTLNSDNSVATFTQFFKKVQNKSDPRFGKLRDTLEVSFPAVSEAYLDSLGFEKLQVILNEYLVQYGKSLIAENSSDWDYIPKPNEITLENLYEEITKESGRGNRILSNANLELISEIYAEWATSVGKSEQAIKTGKQIIVSRFKLILGAPEVILGFASNLNQFFDWLAEQPETDFPAKSVCTALINEILGLMESKVSVSDI